MTNNATWKTVLLGVALAGLGITGTGLALAGGETAAPVAVEAPVAVDPARVTVLDTPAQQTPVAPQAPEQDDADEGPDD